MRLLRFVKPFLAIAFVAGLLTTGYFTRAVWLPWFQNARAPEPAETPGEAVTPTTKVIVSDQAQKNLGLTATQLKAETVWKTITVPGMVVDRPGLSDRGVVAPVTAVVRAVNHVPGDTVCPG